MILLSIWLLPIFLIFSVLDDVYVRIFQFVYITHEFQMKTRKRLFKELMETLQDDSQGKRRNVR